MRMLLDNLIVKRCLGGVKNEEPKNEDPKTKSQRLKIVTKMKIPHENEGLP